VPEAAPDPAAVRAMLEARTVAVVGASARPDSFGHQLLAEITSGDPAIRAYPVNPRYERIGPLPCLPTVSAIGGPVDLVMLGVPNAAVEAELRAAAEIGARSAVVYASGYEPPLPGRPSLTDRMTTIARDAGMAVCGGNCMGFWNLDHGVRALGYAEREAAPRGPVTFLSHSGSAFSTLLRNNRRIGFNLVVSAGQEFVTTVADYARYALTLPTTRVIAILVETARDPANFAAALRAAAEADVPVVALKVGRSPRAKELVTAHSGALAGEDLAYDALFDAYGVLRVHDLDELCDTVELLAAGRRAGPGQLASVHDSGAERALVVDIAEAVGAPFAALRPSTIERLEALLDPGLPATNPVDVWGTGTSTRELFTDSLTVLADDPGVAAVALGIDLVHEYDGDDYYVHAAIDAAKATTKPVVVLSNAQSAVDPGYAAELRAAGVPVLEGTRNGLLALRHLLQLRDFRNRTPVSTPAVDPARRERWIGRLARDPALASAESAALLTDYGIGVTPTLPATSGPEAIAAADRVGYPVALKTDEPSIAHKTDAGGVRLGLRDQTELLAAYDDISGRLGSRVSVSAMVAPGVELALGLVHDPQIGPLVLLAAGGVLIEVIADRVLAVPPVDEDRALALLGMLQARPVLDGIRGRPASDVGSVVSAIVGLSTLAIELGNVITELDVNPLVCGPAGAVAVDALVVQRPT
jgi:acetate---CoA ligase (ADP-forming)